MHKLGICSYKSPTDCTQNIMANERAIMKQMVKPETDEDEDYLLEATTGPRERFLAEHLIKLKKEIQKLKKEIQKLKKIENAYFESWRELGSISFSENNELIYYLIKSGMFPPTIGELKRVREEKPYLKKPKK